MIQQSLWLTLNDEAADQAHRGFLGRLPRASSSGERPAGRVSGRSTAWSLGGKRV